MCHGYHARSKAEFIVTGKKHWEMSKEDEIAMGSQVVTRDELNLYDSLKMMSYFMFLSSMLVVAMGKCGMRTVWKEKSKVGKRVTKKTFYVLCVIFLIGMGIHNEMKSVHRIKKHYHHKNSTQPIDMEDDEQDDQFLKDYSNENAQNMFAEFYPSNDACSATDQDSCDGADACTWCKSAAVASRCYDVNDAKSLPASIFACDKLSDEIGQIEDAKVHAHFNPHEKKIEMTTENAECSATDQDSCDAVDACTWCKSAAVASRCYDSNDAKSLPASIFSCDKLMTEFENSDEEVSMKANIDKMMGYGHHGHHGKDHHGKGHHGKGHHGHHGNHHKIGPMIFLAVVIVHFYFLRCFVQAMEAKEALTGETNDCDWGCGWKKKEKKAKQQEQPEQPQSFAPASSPIVMPVTQMH